MPGAGCVTDANVVNRLNNDGKIRRMRPGHRESTRSRAEDKTLNVHVSISKKFHC